MKTSAAYLIALAALSAACWLVATLFWGAQGSWSGIVQLLLLVLVCVLACAGLILAAVRLSTWVWIAISLVVLAALSIPATTFVALYPSHEETPFGSSQAFTLFLIPSLALIVVALLLYSGLSMVTAPGEIDILEEEDASRRRPYVRAALILIPGAVLLAKALDNIYWLMIWDNTTDPLGYLWLFFPILAAIIAGAILWIITPYAPKWIGPGYALLVSILMIGLTARAQRVDYRALTETRAGLVGQAIEAYYTREGHYPENLSLLAPRYMLTLPEPVIIFGQGWCYEAGEDSYSLGYVTREYWYDPRLRGRLAASRGEASGSGPICSQEIAAIQARYPAYPFVYWPDQE